VLCAIKPTLQFSVLEQDDTAWPMSEMIHAHPMLTEDVMEAMNNVRGSAIHLIRKRAGA
jgi:hypothetical protein